MLHPFDKLTVDTFAGPYVIELHYDLDAAAPDYTDEPFTAQAPLGLAHMLDEARAAVAEDSAERIAQANTVGAGIIGLI